MSLFKLTNQLLELQQTILDNPDLDDQVVKDTLSSINEDRYDKIDQIWTLIKDLESEAKQRDDYIKDSQRQKKALLNHAKRLKNYLMQDMKAADEKRIQTEHYRLSTRVNHRVEITDTSLLPAEYYRQPKPVIDKTHITDDIKKGKKVPGAEYVETKSLQGR